ncbi:DUF3455 domain-containing protein [Streptomyces sp. NRRL F-5135]|uniref:DUF3455 domain-containing protein n=1 Tax=Streptomyces sp. NRRL F-5135 TaxID=1463858 RepID=UPI0004CAA79A|nr:DUF3455 domain-containing protein [Streptomyces sp. NRRL F-5135]
MKLGKRLSRVAGGLALASGLLVAGASTSSATVGTTDAVAGADGASVAASGAARAHVRDVPETLRVPDGHQRGPVLSARGVQVYTCAGGGWTLLEPAATLWREGDRTKTPVALHSRGPVWVSTTDGSAVTATAVANSPREGAVPELLLKAADHRGTGVFSKVSYIQRLETRGGVAPAGTCADGTQTAVPYSATYVFHTPAA